MRRAEAVKDYLTSKGVEKNRVYTEGKGEKQPVADNKTKEGKAKNRRVEIEVVGTRTKEVILGSLPVNKPRPAGFSFLDGPSRMRAMTTTTTTTNADPRNSPSSASWPTAGGIRERVPPAAPDQPAAPGLDRRLVPLAGKQVLDVGCGGGILSDSMARRGANVLGIDLASKSAQGGAAARDGGGHGVGRLPRGGGRGAGGRAPAPSTSSPAWRCSSTCPIRRRWCVPARPWSNPAAGCSSRPSTATPRPSCSPSSAPSTCCNCCPKGTHEYARFIRPSELVGWCRDAGLDATATRGLDLQPDHAPLRLSADTSVNYLMACRKAGMMPAVRAGAVRPRRHADRLRPDLAGAGNDMRARGSGRCCRWRTSAHGGSGARGMLGVRFGARPTTDFEALRDEFLQRYERRA